MSKLYEKYVKLKRENSEDVYLFKSGIFYLFLDDDAKKVSEKLNLKLVNLNDEIVKCGFPSSKLDKYVELLEKNDISYKIINSNLEVANNVDEYIINSNNQAIVDRIKQIDINSISPLEAINILSKLQQDSKSLERINA